MANVEISLRPAWRNYWPTLFLANGLIIAAIIIGITGIGLPVALVCAGAAVLFYGYILMQRYSWRFTIDENRISRHQGIISRNQQSIRLADLRSVELNQSLGQRLLGLGDLSFYSSGSDDAEVRFFGIRNPATHRDNVYDTMDQLEANN